MKKDSNYLIKNYDQKMNIEIGPNGIYVQRFSNHYDKRFIHDISIYDNNQVINYENNINKYLSNIKHNVMARKVEEFKERYRFYCIR